MAKRARFAKNRTTLSIIGPKKTAKQRGEGTQLAIAIAA